MSHHRFSILSVAVFLFGLSLLAFPAEATAKRYDFVVGGKLTDDARIIGTTKPEGDKQDDEAFVFGGLLNFVYAGAGFTSTGPGCSMGACSCTAGPLEITVGPN